MQFFFENIFPFPNSKSDLHATHQQINSRRNTWIEDFDDGTAQ